MLTSCFDNGSDATGEEELVKLRRRVRKKELTKLRGWYLSKEQFSSAEERNAFLSLLNTTLETLYLNPYTLNDHKVRDPLYYRKIQFDPVWACNFRCSYCNAKPDRLRDSPLDEKLLISFLEEKVLGVDRFNIGCGMEPLLYKKIGRLAAAIRDSVAPAGIYGLQTNGMLLDRLSVDDIKRSGLNLLSLSMDALIPSVSSFVRRGIDNGKILRSVARIMDNCSDVRWRVVCTVSRPTIKQVEELIAFCVSFGASIITLRHVLPPQSKPFFYVDQKKYSTTDLSISEAKFLGLANKILGTYGRIAEIEIIGHPAISAHSKNTNKGGWQAKTWEPVSVSE